MNKPEPVHVARSEYYMKQKLLGGLMALVLVPAVFGQPSDLYENWGLVQCPPEVPPTIDAFNFVNHNQFYVTFTNMNLATLPVTVKPFETTSTTNYLNDFGAVMNCNTGFRMETYPESGPRQRAGSLVNNGTIECGTTGNSNVFFINGFVFNLNGTGSGVKCQVDATNIYNPGTINMAYDSLLSLKAENLDLSHGILSMQNTSFNGINGLFIFNTGFYDGYWGLGIANTNFYPYGLNPDNFYGATPPRTQTHIVTNRDYTISAQTLGGTTNFLSYLLDTTDFSGSNRTVRAVFLSNTNPAITAKVYLSSYYQYALDPDVVELSSTLTNFQGITTNYLYIQDSFLTYTNIQVFLGGFAGVGNNRPTYMPENYSIYQGNPFFFGGTPATSTTIPRGTFTAVGSGNVTNQYTAYQALFQPGSTILADVPGQNVTNQAGRIEVTADKYLVLPEAQISGSSYLLLKSTNHFGGSDGAQISAPFADVYLRSTNGLLNLTNVLMPSLALPIGVCDLFSARWTNLVAGVTNRFHVFFVDVQLQPNALLMVQTLNLTVTNAIDHTNDDSIYLRDVFNVTSNLLINTRRLTVTTNTVDSLTPAGVINYLNPSILWPTSTPRLQYLTNNGAIRCQNFAVFGGSQTSPLTGPDSSSNAYAAFVNSGGVTNLGAAIFANYFQNSGIFFASGGALRLRQAQTVILTNGAFLAPGAAGLITIQGSSLLISNHMLQAGAALTLIATNCLDDGSLSAGADTVTNKNTWYAGYGANLPIWPTNGCSLLATTISNTGPAGALVTNLWAGRDFGCQPRGFLTNAALGRLILDGRDNRTRFNFLRTAANNALYVDSLELKDWTTNASAVGNFTGVNLDTNFTIYYGDAIVAGHSIAEKLNGKYGYTGTNGGRFLWVSNYNTGFYSSTNVTYTDGSVHRLNRALVYSCNLNSNGQPYPPTGGANATCDGTILKPDPIAVPPASLLFAATAVTNANPSVRSIVLSWNAAPLSSNALFAAPSPLTLGTNWQLLTNFVSDFGGRATVTDTMTNTPRYYRVQVQTP